MYRLWIENEAKAEVKSLPGNMRQRIRRAIEGLATEPRPHISTRIRAPSDFQLEVRRLRMEHWRVIYIVDEEYKEIGVLAVRRRPPYDYQDLDNLLKGISRP